MGKQQSHSTNYDSFLSVGLWSLLLGLTLMTCSQQEPSKTPSAPPEEVVPIEKDIPTTPPKVERTVDLDTTQWLDFGQLDSTIVVDMRYASTNNFVKEKLYNCGRCLLRPEMAQRLLQAHRELQTQGFGLKVFDCYRPRPVQQRLWAKVPNPNYVTPPEKGSMHNRGAAVDLTIVDVNKKELDMGTEFDFFGKEAHHDYMEHDSIVLANRKMLKDLMQKVGFQPIRTEWWHYSFRGKGFPISDMLWNCPGDH